MAAGPASMTIWFTILNRLFRGDILLVWTCKLDRKYTVPGQKIWPDPDLDGVLLPQMTGAVLAYVGPAVYCQSL